MSKVITLKKANCKDCHKCIRNCPVKSIRFTGNQAHIIQDECILCGTCFVVCPHDAKEIRCELDKAKAYIRSGTPTIVSLAPSFIANYKTGINAMRKALKKLGFTDVEETAIGATIVKKEYDRILKEGTRDILISSCCHSVNLLIQKYFPNEIKYLADVLSPMQAHSLDIKKRHPEAKVVFIGPCIAKKDEGEMYKGITDAVLTFKELSDWLKEEEIELEKDIDTIEESKARFFPIPGGILKTMDKDSPDYTYLAVDGIANCIEALKNIEEGKIHHCFIEMNACSGGCVNGPVMEKYNPSLLEDYLLINKYAGKKDFMVEDKSREEIRKDFTSLKPKVKIPSEDEIRDVLHQLGKFTSDDEINCGTCGYPTCREKAKAVVLGKAELSMCLPYLQDKAKSLSNSIFNNTPNGIIVVNENMEVQQINKKAMKILNLKSGGDVLGEQLVSVLDPHIFLKVRETKRTLKDQKVFLAEYQKYVLETVVYDEKNRLYIGLIVDVTEEEVARLQKEDIALKTVKIADKVIDKQMRIVQEIASLLGETAAETQIALSKLKDSIKDDEK